MTASHSTELAGLLRLHAPPVLASYVPAPLLAEFRRRYPKILIDLEVESAKEPPIEEFDITLLGTDERFDGDIVARKVIESEAILVASPHDLKRRGEPKAPQDLVNHTDTLTRAELVRVLSPWITGQLALYAALPSRKFIPHRTRVFLDYLVEETRLQTSQALMACTSGGS